MENTRDSDKTLTFYIRIFGLIENRFFLDRKAYLFFQYVLYKFSYLLFFLYIFFFYCMTNEILNNNDSVLENANKDIRLSL